MSNTQFITNLNGSVRDGFPALNEPANEMMTTETNNQGYTELNPLGLDLPESVSAIANTPGNDFSQSPYPAWFHQLIQQLRHYRPWRFLIRSDNTIDLDSLTALALRAQQRAGRHPLLDQQLSLFPNPLPDEVTTVTPNPAYSEKPGIPSFTVITGANRCDNQSAITLSDDILTIKSGEQLHEYLRRVADAAVVATIHVTGSQQAALARLGSKVHTPPHARPMLSLAPSPTSSKSEDPKARL